MRHEASSLDIRDDIHLDGAVVVVGEVWQRRPVLAQCVVAGVGVVMVVTVRNICRKKTNTWHHVCCY